MGTVSFGPRAADLCLGPGVSRQKFRLPMGTLVPQSEIRSKIFQDPGGGVEGACCPESEIKSDKIYV